MYISFKWRKLTPSAISVKLPVVPAREKKYTDFPREGILTILLIPTSAQLWIRNSWFLQFAMEENPRSQNWHLYGFSPVWTRSWLLQLPIEENPRSQNWHLNSLSFACVISCMLQSLFLLNGFSQNWHLKDFTSRHKTSFLL